MKIHRGIVKSKVIDLTEKELTVIQSYFNEFECGSKLYNEDERSIYSGLTTWLKKQGLEVEVDSDEYPETLDIRLIDIDDTILNQRELRDYQVAAIRKALHFGRGIIQVSTGGGKTEIAAGLYAHLSFYGFAENAVILVPTVFLMEQMTNRLQMFGFNSVCCVGGGSKYKPGYKVYVFVVDSAYRGLDKPEVKECIENAEVLLLDEAHHAGANSWTKVCEACLAPYRYAFTATVYDDPSQYSKMDLVLIGLIGPVIFEVRSKELRDRGYLADPLVTVLVTESPQVRVWDWDSVYKIGVVQNRRRNNVIKTLACKCFEAGSKVMIFVGRKNHGHDLAAGITEQLGKEVCFVHGNNTAYLYKPMKRVSRQRWSVDDVASYINDRDKAILITTTVLDEGLDVPVIDVLIMGTAMKKYRRTVQRCGRGMRPKEGHNRVYIFDFYDNNHPYLEKHSRYRLWTYKSEMFDMSRSLAATAKVMGADISVDSLAS